MTIEIIRTDLDIRSEETLPSGRLCLEFANTADWHASDHPQERIPTYRDLVQWANQTGLLDAGATAHLLQQAESKPNAARATHAAAIALREALYRIFSAVAAGRTASAQDVNLLSEKLPNALARVKLESVEPSASTGPSFRLRWDSDPQALDYFLEPVVRSAVSLLVAGELDRVRECADDRGCGYLFYDTTRNRSRRWCDMNSCGNRAKARRHYARHSAHSRLSDTLNGEHS